MMTKEQILAMSADELRLKFGELTAQEIRTIRAVVAVIESPDCDALMAHAEAMEKALERYREDLSDGPENCPYRRWENVDLAAAKALAAFRSAYPKEEAR